ncbi:MAG: hypothetical protein WBO16_15510, partial [Gammaproteobacteria bacterium]
AARNASDSHFPFANELSFDSPLRREPLLVFEPKLYREGTAVVYQCDKTHQHFTSFKIKPIREKTEVMNRKVS